MNLELKEMIEKVGEGFDEEVAKLTGIVSQEFSRVLEEIELSSKVYRKERKVKINDFKVKYNPQSKTFSIEIKDWSVNIDGKPFSDKTNTAFSYCAYDYLNQVISDDEKVSSQIRKFKEDFNVKDISYDCQCGSDHE